MLPEGHPQRTSVLLERAVVAVEGSLPAHIAPQLLQQMMEEEDAAFYQVRTPALSWLLFGLRVPASKEWLSGSCCKILFVMLLWSSCLVCS